MTSTPTSVRVFSSKISSTVLRSNVRSFHCTKLGARKPHLWRHEPRTTHLSILYQGYLGYNSPTITQHNPKTIRGTDCPAAQVRNKRWITSFSNSTKAKVDQKRSEDKRWTTRTVDIPIGGNGVASLEISTSSVSRSIAQENQFHAGDVAIHLPPGPLPQSAIDQEAQREYLSHDHLLHELLLVQSIGANEQCPISTVITIHYRLSPRSDSSSSEDHRYPTPIHDVSVAFTWILEHLSELQSGYDVTTLEQSRELDRNQQPPRISIFGSHIGGSLALMLALTQPNEIYAVAVHDPVTDWVALDELASSEEPSPFPTTKKRGSLTAESRFSTMAAAAALINLRTSLFRNPSGFFDAFASPLMFLRAPGRDTPLWRTAKPEAEMVEAGIVEAMKRDGGVEVSEAETRELVRERGYGPYDDDWDAAEHEGGLDARNGSERSVLGQAVTDLSNLSLAAQTIRAVRQQSETDLSALQLQEQPHHIHRSPPPTSTISTTSPSTPSSPSTRRRKVIRRWPPINRPEDVELPYIRIYSTQPLSPAHHEADAEPSVELAHVLHPQAKEMVDVMRRACFWGRETSFAEGKVGLEPVDVWLGGDGEQRVEGKSPGVTGMMVAWVRGIDEMMEQGGRD